MVGINNDAFVILGGFAIASIILIIFASLCVVGFFLFIANMIMKRQRVHVASWVNIVTLIILSAVLSWGLIHIFGLDAILAY